MTLSSAMWYQKAMRLLKIKSPQGRKINWWDGLCNESIARKRREMVLGP